MSILAVDDVSVVWFKLKRFLGDKGYQVHTAQSAEEALEILITDNRISLVVTDLFMGAMNGVELFKASQRIDRIGDEGTTQAPDFILMTALRDDSGISKKDKNLLVEAKFLGFLEVFHKPVDKEKLAYLAEQCESSFIANKAQSGQNASVESVQEQVAANKSDAITSSDIEQLNAEQPNVEKPQSLDSVDKLSENETMSVIEKTIGNVLRKASEGASMETIKTVLQEALAENAKDHYFQELMSRLDDHHKLLESHLNRMETNQDAVRSTVSRIEKKVDPSNRSRRIS